MRTTLRPARTISDYSKNPADISIIVPLRSALILSVELVLGPVESLGISY